MLAGWKLRQAEFAVPWEAWGACGPRDYLVKGRMFETAPSGFTT
jgi:hypothetical protein